jgi:hypothetical protein
MPEDPEDTCPLLRVDAVVPQELGHPPNPARPPARSNPLRIEKELKKRHRDHDFPRTPFPSHFAVEKKISSR